MTGTTVIDPSKINGIWDAGRKGWNFYTGLNQTGGQIFFPEPGYRYFVGYLTKNGVGYYWTAEPIGEGAANTLTFYDNRLYLLKIPNNSSWQTTGYAIRPIRE